MYLLANSSSHFDLEFLSNNPQIFGGWFSPEIYKTEKWLHYKIKHVEIIKFFIEILSGHSHQRTPLSSHQISDA